MTKYFLIGLDAPKKYWLKMSLV